MICEGDSEPIGITEWDPVQWPHQAILTSSPGDEHGPNSKVFYSSTREMEMDLATELDSLHPMCSNFVAVHHNQWDQFFWPFLKETVEHIRPTLRDVIIRYNLPPAPILDPDEKWYRLQCSC